MSDNQEKLSENDFKDPYEFGFETDIESDFAPKGLNEDVIRFISNKKRGKNGFGYDPIFIPLKKQKTFAEMQLKDKYKIDHRYQAFKKIKKFF